MKYNSNKNVVYSCKYHIVWCSKYRRPVLEGPIADCLKEIIRAVCEECRLSLLEMEVMPDHVHLLLEVDPQFGVHKAVKRIKGMSSRILRAEFPSLRSRLPTLWTNSYFISTVGGSPLTAVKEYIERQKSV